MAAYLFLGAGQALEEVAFFVGADVWGELGFDYGYVQGSLVVDSLPCGDHVSQESGEHAGVAHDEAAVGVGVGACLGWFLEFGSEAFVGPALEFSADHNLGVHFSEALEQHVGALDGEGVVAVCEQQDGRGCFGWGEGGCDVFEVGGDLLESSCLVGVPFVDVLADCRDFVSQVFVLGRGGGEFGPIGSEEQCLDLEGAGGFFGF